MLKVTTTPDRHADAVTRQLDNALADLVDLTADRHMLSHATRVALREQLMALAGCASCWQWSPVYGRWIYVCD